MKKIIYITNLPAFYKTNLLNAISEKADVFVIYTHLTDPNRKSDFFKGKKKFKHHTLTPDKRWKNILFLFNKIKNESYDELIIGGWDLFYFWICLFLGSSKSNALVVESSIYESKFSGIAGLMKRLFLSRIGKVYASGTTQKKLCDALGYKGVYKITKGVGLFNIIPQPSFKIKDKVHKFLYVGRLAKEKNLKLLIETFNRLPNLELTIVGFGPMEAQLKSFAKNNTTFLGAVDNQKLPSLYQSHDVFVLPSISEPWGMVVEEALNNGLPIITSDRVGCANDLVGEKHGIIFSLNVSGALEKAICEICEHKTYYKFLKNISKLNFKAIGENQVSLYL